MDESRAFEIALGDEVRAARARKRLTIPQLAERAGVGKSTIERLESASHATSVPNTWAVARALGLELSALVRAAEEAAYGEGRSGLASVLAADDVAEWARSWVAGRQDGPYIVAAPWYPTKTRNPEVDIAILNDDGDPLALLELKSSSRPPAPYMQERQLAQLRTYMQALKSKPDLVVLTTVQPAAKLVMTIADALQPDSDSLSSFDDDLDAAARNEDRERPRMGDD